MRNNMVQILGEDYTRLARAKGLQRRRIALTYGARVAILPNVTGFAIALGGILGGTVLVETIFNYPGHGPAAVRGGGQPRLPADADASSCSPPSACWSRTSLADLLYGLLDPRVREEGDAA